MLIWIPHNADMYGNPTVKLCVPAKAVCLQNLRKKHCNNVLVIQKETGLGNDTIALTDELLTANCFMFILLETHV